MKKIKKKGIIIVKVLLYCCSIGCIMYPLISRYLAYRSQSEVISNYEEKVTNTDKTELEEKLKKADEYNEQIATETEVVEIDEGINTYDFLETGEVIGYIEISKINVSLPIFEDVTEENLLKGVGHIENTSLPTGEKNTHSVLAGHTGMSQVEIFDRIDELEIGDEISITFLEKTTKYQVISKNTVLPTDTSSLKIEEGRCLVTLVTCTPKTVNTHRLLVTAEKIEDETDIVEEAENTTNEVVAEVTNEEETTGKLLIKIISNNKITFIVILLVIIILVIVEIIKRIFKKKNKNRNGNKTKK